jgi:hypothetical protein
LQRRLEDRLLANAETRWVAKQIRVAVDRGKATLSGRVNLWSERQAAGRVAFRTYGVRLVDNQLGVVSPEGRELSSLRLRIPCNPTEPGRRFPPMVEDKKERRC